MERDTGTDLSIELPAQPDSVAVIREAVAERARALGLDRQVVDDLRTVVSEACANVVLHAYPDEPEERPLEVDLARRKDGLKLTVRDKGCGIQPARDGERADCEWGSCLSERFLLAFSSEAGGAGVPS